MLIFVDCLKELPATLLLRRAPFRDAGDHSSTAMPRAAASKDARRGPDDRAAGLLLLSR